jgi:phosphoribosyl 1,2-cyclic phosphodiesterase
MIRFLILGSGSKGNATLVYDEDTLFQIDMGVPFKRVVSGLKAIERNLSDVTGVLITHEHIDHVGTLGTLPSFIPTYAPLGTLAHPSRLVMPEEPFPLGSFYITPIALSHDAANTVGFIITHQNEKLVYVTDTGFIPEPALPYMKNGTYYIIESNHDLKMLMHSQRPLSLKLRIKGDLGHLSNRDSADYLSGLVSSETKGIYLAHLSEECNTPELALKTYEEVFREHGLNPDDYSIRCAKQWESLLGGDL